MCRTHAADDSDSDVCRSQMLKLRPDARLLIVNRNEHDSIRERLNAGGVSSSAVELKAVGYRDVPSEIAGMSACVFFYRPPYFRAACEPAKLGEFLGCGAPRLTNSSVGDAAEILESERVGAVINDFDACAVENGVRRLPGLAAESGIEKRCVSAAQRYFSLQQSVVAYRGIDESLNPGL